MEASATHVSAQAAEQQPPRAGFTVHVRDYLAKRGLAECDVASFAVETSPSAALQRLGLEADLARGACTALLIAGREADGTVRPTYCQGIFFWPSGKRKRRSAAKRVTPNRAVFVGDANARTVVICESVVKATVVAKLGYLAVGLNGIQGWSAGDNKLVQNLAPPPWPRTANVVILFDSLKDSSRRDVQRAERTLVALLRDTAASVSIARLPPPIDNRDDWGADDYYAECGATALRCVIESAVLAAAPVSTYVERMGEHVATQAPPQPKAVVPDIFPCASTIFQGAGHEGKSVALLFMAFRIALGLPLFGRPIARRGKVLYVFGEDSTLDVRWLAHLITRNDPQFAAREAELNANVEFLNVANLPGFPIILERNREGGWQPGALVHYIDTQLQTGGYSLVIIDTLSSVGLPETEGMNDALKVYHRAAAQLCERYEIGIVASHHLSQAAAEDRKLGMYASRGASATADSARCVLQLQRDRGEDQYPAPPQITPADRQDEALYISRIHVIKHKWSSLREQTPLWIKSQGYWCQDYDAVTGAAAVASRSTAMLAKGDARLAGIDGKVMQAVGHLGNPTAEDVCTFLAGSVGEKNARASLARLVGAADLTSYQEERAGPGRKPMRFRLSDKKWARTN